LSRQRRVALDKRLFRIELTDHDLTFETRIQGTLPSAHARRDLALLLVALRDLTHLGGHKGRGLGRCQVTLDVVKLDETAHPWQSLVEELR
jgi:CRISPR/Cas system CSM-associated protein Csm3 (group 7 of RAMP superfamily)